MAQKVTFVDMTEDDFYSKFNPVKNHLVQDAAFDGCMFETYGKEFEHVKEIGSNEATKQTLWTIVDSEDKLFFISGYHYVNRLGYLITKEPVEEGIEISVELDNLTDNE